MTVFCQGNKDQLTAAAATYQHSERECKSALMQMSYVFGGRTDCLYTNPPLEHNTLLCATRAPRLPSNPVLEHTYTNTSRRQSCAEREKCNHKRQHHCLTSQWTIGHSTTGPFHKHKHTFGKKKKRDKPTYLSVMASASEYWFIKTPFCLSLHKWKWLK